MQKSSLVVQPKIMQAQEYGLTKERIMITPKMNILQIPIIDEFSASSKSMRTAKFAAEKDFGPKILAEHLALIVVPFHSPPQSPIQRLSLY
ncbi:hypothetical protein BS47DRAFT_1356702, partial [Hydnum rufescens UP504]